MSALHRWNGNNSVPELRGLVPAYTVTCIGHYISNPGKLNSCGTPLTFDQFGLHGTFETKTRNGLYYKAGKDRLLKFVLTRDW